MRQLIHSTTAIAACLSLLAPDFAAAQMTMPSQEPALRLAQAQPNDEEKPRRKRQADEDRAEARQEKRREQQQERRQEAQQERREQRQQARQEERREQRQERRQEAQQEQRQQQRQERREQREKAEAKAQRDQAQSLGDRASERNALPRPAETEPRPSERRQEQRREQRQERAEERRAAENRQERAEERRTNERQEQRADERREQRQERLERDELEAALAARERREERRDNDALEAAQSSGAQSRAAQMPGLDRVLTRELDGGLKDDDLRCLSGGRAPCAEGDRLVTPEGVVVERNRNGRLRLAPGDAQMYRVTRDGDIVPRAAEEGRRETEAARQAARERAARRDFQALLDDRRGTRTERRITEENSRRSSEDFSTSLRDALRDRDRADRDDDSGSDLTKALLLGLGAVAVGSMLNNNRQVALSSPDRVVVTRADGSQEIIKDEVALLRQPGSTVTTEEFDDGSSRTIVTRPDGSRVVTIRDADLRVLRRTLVSADGRTTRLIDDTAEVDPVDVATLPAPAPQPVYQSSAMDETALRDALAREAGVDRRFTLGQIRNIPEVRALVPPIDIDAITFDTGSSSIRPAQADQLATLGAVIQDSIADNPQEIFLIEGHTDSVGSDAANLALSDRRAESVALALSEYYDVPPENLVVQGYGEQYLRVRAEGDIRDNRRASVRRITDLLQTASE